VKSLTEAVNAISQSGAPQANIKAALQELATGDTAKAKAIFSEIVERKAAEGKAANLEAAAAARHLGTLAYLNDPLEALKHYRRLGVIYGTRGDLTQAENMQKQSLQLHTELGNKEGMAANYANLGNIYDTRGDLTQAENMHKQALQLSQELGNKDSMAINYGNLGSIYQQRNDLPAAREVWEKSLALFEQIGSPTAEKVRALLAKLNTGH
jgi:tetratricopeptide (TPR) repeat protein